MVKRVEVPANVTFQSQPENHFPVDEMPEGTTEKVDTWIDETIARNGFEWQEYMGHGAFEGLDEKLTAKFEAVAPKCDPDNCQIHIEVLAGSGRASETELLLECPLISEGDEETAKLREGRCFEAHLKATKAFVTFVARTVADIRDTRYAISGAGARVSSANSHLDQLLR